MMAQSHLAPSTVIDRIPIGPTDRLHVSLDTVHGNSVVDLRVFRPTTPAKAFMPTGKAIVIELGAVAALILALQGALESKPSDLIGGPTQCRA